MATYGTINLDGNLSDWTQSDRLDSYPGSGVNGFEVYGKYDNNAYLFALKADNVSIGANTTFWLNTDQNANTGYSIFGISGLGGAEYNVNFGADNQPYLYSGADGGTLISGLLNYAYDPTQKIVEFAVDSSLMNSVTNPGKLDVLLDVNNAYFLPDDYANKKYTIGLTGNTVTNYGTIALDGNLSDWKASDRLDSYPNNGVSGFEVYGKYDNNAYIFALKADNVSIGANTTFWLNTDQNTNTGYSIFGISGVGGAEYNVNFAADNRPYLYSGADGQTLISGPLNYAYDPTQKIVEFAVDASLINQANPATGLDLLVDVNNSYFLPDDYASKKYSINLNQLPVTTDSDRKIGIVFSQTSANNYFDQKAYSQLFMAMQYQAMQSGIPFDILTEDDLTDLNKIVNYDALVFPSFRNVKTSQLSAIEKNLDDAVYKYGIGLITAGDFLTNDENNQSLPGNAYTRMQRLLNVSYTGNTPGVIQNTPTQIIANDVTHPVMQNYASGEVIRSYDKLFVNEYGVYNNQFNQNSVLANQQVNGQNYSAVLATQTGGRNVHFSSESLMGDNNLVWEALQWAVLDKQPGVRLNMSREASIFLSRTDMDQSAFAEEVTVVDDGLLDILEQWKQNYNFVGSNYINLGNNPDNGEYTDWEVSGPIYQQYLELGNEIGTHSYTHPDYTNTLTPAQLEFEFNQSKSIIQDNLGQLVPGFTLTGSAIPGNPEPISVAQEIKQYLNYVSGGYSGVGAGYPGAFGFMFPDDPNFVYFSPNLSFDFTWIGFQKLNAQQAEAKWEAEYNGIKNHAAEPIFHWPWHDYGPTQAEPGYTPEMYSNFIVRAAQNGTEFVTGSELSDRIKSFEKSQLEINYIDPNTINAKVVATDVGAFGLNVEGKIQSVNNWYAYDQDTVFLPGNGGDYTINLGETPQDVTRIVQLPMRAELVSVSGDGTNLQYVFKGAGNVVIDVKSDQPNLTAIAEGSDSSTFDGNLLTMTFDSEGEHTATVTLGPDNSVIEPNPITDPTVPEDPSNTVTPIEATTGDDSIPGTMANDQLNGLAGNDQLSGGEGNDTLNGGDGNDTLKGQVGNDLLNGDAGDDTLQGGRGQDILNGADGNDQILGGAQDDQIFAGLGNDKINGGRGLDTLTGVDPSQGLGVGEIDTLRGGMNSDRFVLGDANGLYYNDGDCSNLGFSDYALLRDFLISEDTIQLSGNASQYSVVNAQTYFQGSLPDSLLYNSAAILFKNASGSDELIAIVQGYTSLDLAQSYFNFV
ncbi:polysaccharide deacetylase family protein [Planktothricoides raciborskii]|uniref:Polysaccharide deacetylase family protein n=1 Tax=Planktothricoides raciborskii FACHB-1370 TaxID=2949576 RepID=A0ABR8EI40_9CYAN|nr:polysaccharide deacetylase family protein [Planktothricoides raciborskii]MBD2546368.1 polysaccharide deacetylase family protein [Planktothricoides raciborskii FACHB-1370]MBD2584766.1 polysaccharide deacetylase family protein [Planktothricoides raciborskii FACHB-1261]